MSYACLQSNLNKYDFFESEQILCFVLKNCCNFKSYQKHVNIFKFIFLHYTLQLFIK